MRYSVVIDGKQFAGLGRSHVGVVNGKLIQADSFSQLKRTASIEANKENKVEDTLYLLGLPGVEPIVFRRRNKKSPDGTIKRGQWE